MTRTTKKQDRRKRIYAQLAVAQKQLCMDEAAYRELLTRHGAKPKDGKASASTMTVPQLLDALDEMGRKGFQPTPGKPWQPRQPQATQQDKIRSLWQSLHEAGVIKHDNEAAMTAFARRVTASEIDHVNWLDATQANKVIEALKAMERRHKSQQTQTAM